MEFDNATFKDNVKLIDKDFGEYGYVYVPPHETRQRQRDKEVEGLHKRIEDMTLMDAQRDKEVEGLHKRIEDMTLMDVQRNKEVEGLNKQIEDMTLMDAQRNNEAEILMDRLNQRNNRVEGLTKRIEGMTIMDVQRNKEVEGLNKQIEDMTLMDAQRNNEADILLDRLNQRYKEVEGLNKQIEEMDAQRNNEAEILMDRLNQQYKEVEGLTKRIAVISHNNAFQMCKYRKDIDIKDKQLKHMIQEMTDQGNEMKKQKITNHTLCNDIFIYKTQLDAYKYSHYTRNDTSLRQAQTLLNDIKTRIQDYYQSKIPEGKKRPEFTLPSDVVKDEDVTSGGSGGYDEIDGICNAL